MECGPALLPGDVARGIRLSGSPGILRGFPRDGPCPTRRWPAVAGRSETIPLHLLSREALRVYRARLTPRGLLVFHISNRYFDLAPVVAGLAQDAGLEWRVRKEELSDPEEIRRGSIPSTWAVLTSDAAALRVLTADRRWRRVPPKGADVWTDDHSSLLSALR